ncbi:MAG: hypothetical protein QXR69_00470 [Conexivisphaerales archaeon]
MKILIIGLIVVLSSLTLYSAISIASHQQTPYVLRLVIMPSEHNGTIEPRYFVETQNGLASSANITLPANRLIELIVTSYYGMPTQPFEAKYYNVTGTVGDRINIMNMTGQSISTSSLPKNSISHTFTTDWGLNIPIQNGFTEIAYFTIPHAGTYYWACMCPCDYYSMTTAGWMMGIITAY